MKQPDSERHRRIVDGAKKLHQRQINWRRHLHQYPELSFEEVETTRWLTERIREIGLNTRKINMKTGLLAEVRGRKGGPTIAIRTDIDALPVTEQTGLKFASKNNGKMHACGHDVHMAAILGTASLLQSMKDELPGTVRFIFQPAEEKPPGGARPMIENGALDDVGMIFGLHVDPDIPTGKITLRDGVTMGSVFDFDLTIRGSGGHAARPHLAIDPIVTAAEVIQSIQSMISREINPVDPALVTFGEIHGGTARNVIPDEVRLGGTARTLSATMYKKVPKLIERTVAGVCKARGAKFELNRIADYPVLKNSPTTNKLFEQTFTALFGKNKVLPTEPTLAAEDFACYLEKVPGAMFRLGIRNNKLKANKPWHSAEFIVDEDALYYATALLSATALKALDELAR